VHPSAGTAALKPRSPGMRAVVVVVMQLLLLLLLMLLMLLLLLRSATAEEIDDLALDLGLAARTRCR
jgi:hypothetical protein